jgi:hypothetical protein
MGSVRPEALVVEEMRGTCWEMEVVHSARAESEDQAVQEEEAYSRV